MALTAAERAKRYRRNLTGYKFYLKQSEIDFVLKLLSTSMCNHSDGVEIAVKIREQFEAQRVK